MRLRQAVRFVGGAGFPHAYQGRDGETPFMKVSDLSGVEPASTISGAANYLGPNELRALRATVAPRGTILMPKIGAAITRRDRRIVLGRSAAFDNNVIGLIPNRDTSSRYLAFALHIADFAPVTNPGAVASLDLRGLGEIRLGVTGRARQEVVADFLDHEISRIGQLTREVEAYARTLSTPAVSLFAELTASLPRMRISYGFDILLGKMLDAKRVDQADTRPYLRNTNVQWDRIDTTDLKEMTFSPTDMRRYELRRGDLLVCEGGQPGRSAVWQGELEGCYFQKALLSLNPPMCR